MAAISLRSREGICSNSAWKTNLDGILSPLQVYDSKVWSLKAGTLETERKN